MSSVITIEKRDLFSVPKTYALAHCISADRVMGAGIAAQFVKRYPFLKEIRTISKPNVGDVMMAFDNETRIYNLITKERYFEKPTLCTLELSLNSMFFEMRTTGTTRVAMPKIGCGLDKLAWDDVRGVLKLLLNNYQENFEVLVCTL